MPSGPADYSSQTNQPTEADRGQLFQLLKTASAAPQRSSSDLLFKTGIHSNRQTYRAALPLSGFHDRLVIKKTWDPRASRRLH